MISQSRSVLPNSDRMQPLPPLDKKNHELAALSIDTMLTIRSQSEDFRAFQNSIPHPIDRLGLAYGTTEYDTARVEDSLSTVEESIEELILFISNIPSSIKLEAMILVSKLFRTKSDLHQPLFDLINQVKLYSRPWEVDPISMKQLERDYALHYHVLDIAIAKVESAEATHRKVKAQHGLSLWQKLSGRILVFLF